MNNGEIRAWYLERVAEIPKLDEGWVHQGLSIEQRAFLAWQIRHEARIASRLMMEKPHEVEDLRERDRRFYGRPDGPTFDQLVEKNIHRGLTGDEVYEQIITDSQTTNREVNKRFATEIPSTQAPDSES